MQCLGHRRASVWAATKKIQRKGHEGFYKNLCGTGLPPGPVFRPTASDESDCVGWLFVQPGFVLAR